MSTINFPKRFCYIRLVRNAAYLALFLSGVCHVLADVATIREKGPKSGSVFSNPGVVSLTPFNQKSYYDRSIPAAQPDPDRKVTMKSAQVKVVLRAAEDNKLAADVTADFEMIDVSAPATQPSDFLVAFPVTGLKSKVVSVDRFKVLVDGAQPPLVFRQAIALSRRESKLQDSPIVGQLDARFAPDKGFVQGLVMLTDESGYNASYVWEQHTKPGITTHISVCYTVTLTAQSIHYSKSYISEPDDSEVIPFSVIDVDKWNDQYFFFDYVLTSGATWFGPIGSEIIEITADPALGNRIIPYLACQRPQIGRRWFDNASREATDSTEQSSDGEKLRIGIKNTKPSEDLLLIIPAAKIKRQTPKS